MGIEIEHEYIYMYIFCVKKLWKQFYRPYVKSYKVGDVGYLKIMFGNIVSGNYPKENMNQYMFLSCINCKFAPLFDMKAYGHLTRFAHCGEEKNA
jgi:hypothetical protein